jgi:metal-responsive CopG/Arc/MetJ family transcriptional regulator
MKTAISLPDEVFVRADRLAKRLRKTRSELYREAVTEFIARHDPDEVTSAMNRVVDDVGAAPDAFSKAAAKRVLRRTEW